MAIQSERPKRLAQGLVGIVAGAMISFSAPSIRADDVLATNDVSTSSTLDLDGDGLTNDYESVIGTLPNNADTDGDGFKDGSEAVNPGLDGNPLSGAQPSTGNCLYNFSTIQNITLGDTKNAFSPIWLVGGRMGYIESESDFSNGAIYLKNIFDLAQQRTSLFSGLDAKLREISSTPFGLFVYFNRDSDADGKDEIWKVSRVGAHVVTKALPPIGQTLEYSVRNPCIRGRLKINAGTVEDDGNLWLVAETDNPTPSTGQLYAFKLNAVRNWDGTSPIQVTDFTRKTARPKISRDGDKIMFQEIRNSDGKTQLYVYQGLDDILNGITTPFRLPHVEPQDLRGERVEGDFGLGVRFPVGFGGANNFAYWTRDINNVYRLTDSLNFSGADFDIIAAHIGVYNGRFQVLSPGAVRVPLLGNQISGGVSKEGARIAFADDYLADGTLGGNFNLYATGFLPLIRIVPDMPLDVLNGFTAPSGLSFEDETGQMGLNTGSDPDFSPNTLGMLVPRKPISNATEAGSFITNISRFGPSGLTFVDDLKIKQPWGIEDLIMPDGKILNEETMTISHYNSSTGLYEPLPEEQIVEKNVGGRYIIWKALGFSEYGMKAEVIPGTNAVKPQSWQMYSSLSKGLLDELIPAKRLNDVHGTPVVPALRAPYVDSWALYAGAWGLKGLWPENGLPPLALLGCEYY